MRLEQQCVSMILSACAIKITLVLSAKINNVRAYNFLLKKLECSKGQYPSGGACLQCPCEACSSNDKCLLCDKDDPNKYLTYQILI